MYGNPHSGRSALLNDIVSGNAFINWHVEHVEEVLDDFDHVRSKLHLERCPTRCLGAHVINKTGIEDYRISSTQEVQELT